VEWCAIRFKTIKNMPKSNELQSLKTTNLTGLKFPVELVSKYYAFCTNNKI